jgi:hypothetical protein
VVLATLSRYGIATSGRNRIHPGQLPSGYDYRHYGLVKNQAESRVFRLMQQDQAGGLSPHQIVDQLN